MSSNRDHLLATLRSLKNRTGDTEMNHYDADAALIDYIDDPEIAEAYDDIGKWYA